MTHSWLAIAALALVSSATSVLGQQQSEDHQFNITSPITNGVYVAGQTLPCTYRLDDSTPDSLQLNIYLAAQAGTTTNFTETAIAVNADVSKDTSSAQTENNQTFYLHNYNYLIPTTTPAGSYQVVFNPTNTNVNTTIPITIRAAVASSSSTAPSGTSSGSKPSLTSLTQDSAAGNVKALSVVAVSVTIAAAIGSSLF